MYKAPFVNYPEHYNRIWDETMRAVTECLSKGDLILRGQLREFEESVAKFVGTKYAIGLNSGTDALWLSLIAAGVKPGDEVITVSHTFVASIAVIVHCGATPILVDVGKDFNMDMNKLEAAITPKTKVIMPVHLNGRVCDMKKLMAIAERNNIAVVEDAAQALGASFAGRKAGSFGLTGCFSFYPAKILGCAGDGGIVTTDDKAADETIRLLRDHGQDRATGDIYYYGFNSRLDNLQAAILNVKLKHLPDWIERRRELALRYEKGLKNVPEVITPPAPQPENHYFDVFTNYVIRAKNRDKLLAHFKEEGVEYIVSWPMPNHKQKALKLDHFKLPETEKVSREVVSLPLFPEIKNEQVDYVIKSIKKFYSK